MTDIATYTTHPNEPGAVYKDGIIYAEISTWAVPSPTADAIREEAEFLARALNASAYRAALRQATKSFEKETA